MWELLFAISLTINTLMFLYVRWLLKTLAAINEDIENLGSIVMEFTKHVKSVHDLEMFYGDETLKSLTEHGNKIIETLEGLDLVLDDRREEESNIQED
jgi:hypothetical protein